MILQMQSGKSRSRMKYLCFFTTLVLLCSALLSDAGPSYLQVYRKDDGLAYNYVRLVSIGNSGVKWFICGSDKVSRFDGIRWPSPVPGY